MRGSMRRYPSCDNHRHGEARKEREKQTDGLIRVIVETPRESRNKYAFDKKEKAADGDPTDVLILMDQAAFPGVVANCRVVGIIEGEQTEDGQTVRNDRVIAVEANDHRYAAVQQPFKVPDVLGPKEAERRIREERSR